MTCTIQNLDQSIGLCQAYEKSFMHREAVTHLSVSVKTNFLMTASQDGHVKFWHKMDAGSDAQVKAEGAGEGVNRWLCTYTSYINILS